MRRSINITKIKTIKPKIQAYNELDKLSFLHSRADPNQEYYGLHNTTDTPKFIMENGSIDQYAELAWRHVTYDPPEQVHYHIKIRN